MNHFLPFFGLTLCFLVGCNQVVENKTQKDDIAQLRKDSIAAVEAEKAWIQQAKQDSIVIIEQEKVIGAILFGMSEKVVKSKIKEFLNDNRKPDETLGRPYYDYFIGNYEFTRIDDFYYQDSLCKVIINGKPILWEYYDSEVPRQIRAVTDVIRAKYNSPDTHLDLEPRYKLKKNHSYLINSWSVGTKEIQIRLADQGTSYWVNVVIKKPKVENRIDREKRAKESQATQKDKDVF